MAGYRVARGKSFRAGREESAFPGRRAPFLLGVQANWEAPENDDDNLQWVRDCVEDMRQFSDGSVYLNFPGFFEDREGLMETTFGGAYERLAAVKGEWTPGGCSRRKRAVRGPPPASSPRGHRGRGDLRAGPPAQSFDSRTRRGSAER